MHELKERMKDYSKMKESEIALEGKLLALAFQCKTLFKKKQTERMKCGGVSVFELGGVFCCVKFWK